VFLFDGITILYDTVKLRTFQDESSNDKELKESQAGAPEPQDKPQSAVVEVGRRNQPKRDLPISPLLPDKDHKRTISLPVYYAALHTDDDDDFDDVAERNEQRPVDNRDRALAIFTLISHTVFAVDLTLIVGTNKINSGTLVSMVIWWLLLMFWYYYTIRHRNMPAVTESWLLNHRLATILHLFLFLVFFWVSLCIILLARTTKGEFFGTLKSLEPSRASLCGVLIVLFFSHILDYGVMLYVHSRSMWSLDEIASLYLAVKLQEKLRIAD